MKAATIPGEAGDCTESSSGELGLRVKTVRTVCDRSLEPALQGGSGVLLWAMLCYGNDSLSSDLQCKANSSSLSSMLLPISLACVAKISKFQKE